MYGLCKFVQFVPAKCSKDERLEYNALHKIGKICFKYIRCDINMYVYSMDICSNEYNMNNRLPRSFDVGHIAVGREHFYCPPERG